MGKFFITVGILFIVIGVLYNVVPLFRLPGDFKYESENVKVYFPLATSILISVILTIILNVILKIKK